MKETILATLRKTFVGQMLLTVNKSDVYETVMSVSIGEKLLILQVESGRYIYVKETDVLEFQ